MSSFSCAGRASHYDIWFRAHGGLCFRGSVRGVSWENILGFCRLRRYFKEGTGQRGKAVEHRCAFININPMSASYKG